MKIRLTRVEAFEGKDGRRWARIDGVLDGGRAVSVMVPNTADTPSEGEVYEVEFAPAREPGNYRIVGLLPVSD